MTDLAGPRTRGALEGRFADLEAHEPYPGVVRRSFDSDKATVNQYAFAPAARFPIHRHESEQITLIEEGEVDLTVDGVTRRLRAGDWSVVAGDVEHGITAGPDGARIVAVVVPRRERADAYTVVGGAS